MAERIRRGTGVVKVLTKDTIVGVTVSLGVAVLGVHGADLCELLDAADRALYRAKRTGRDRVCLADPAGSPGAYSTTVHVEVKRVQDGKSVFSKSYPIAANTNGADRTSFTMVTEPIMLDVKKTVGFVV